MELVNAPVADLRGLLAQSFEEWAQAGRSCALSGDATALIFLPALRAANVNWAQITLFWTHSTHDQPAPPDDRLLRASRSNEDLVDELLLRPLGAKAPRALNMSADLTRVEGGPLDLVIVGVGEDGRLPLTMELLLQATKVWVVAVGARKLPALHAALSRSQQQTPLDLLLFKAKDVTVFTDQVIRRR